MFVGLENQVLEKPALAGHSRCPLTLAQLAILHALFSPEKPQYWNQLKGQAKYRIKNRAKQAAQTARYRRDNPDKVKAALKRWRTTRRDYAIAACRKYKVDNVERLKVVGSAWYQKNREQVLELKRQIRDSDRPAFRRKTREYHNRRYYSDENFRLISLCRSRIAGALKAKAVKAARTLALIGCTVPELKQYLETQFRPSMSWNNHGTVWEIDHKRPCASFDFTDPAQQHECFHFSNLQPLFVDENRAKAAR